MEKYGASASSTPNRDQDRSCPSFSGSAGTQTGPSHKPDSSQKKKKKKKKKKKQRRREASEASLRLMRQWPEEPGDKVTSSLVGLTQEKSPCAQPQPCWASMGESEGAGPTPVEAIQGGLSEEETLMMLHLFYLARAAQEGFFPIISQTFSKPEYEAMTSVCDRLIGSSLFAATAPSSDTRKAKQDEVSDLLKKLARRTKEPVIGGFSTTFDRLHDLVEHVISQSLKQQKDQGTAPPWTMHGPLPYQIWVLHSSNETDQRMSWPRAVSGSDGDQHSQMEADRVDGSKADDAGESPARLSRVRD